MEFIVKQKSEIDKFLQVCVCVHKQVMVTDVNEFDPVFDPTTPYTATISEDEATGYTVKDLGADDDDSITDTAFTFSITGGNGDNKFAIDSVSGVIRLQAALDRENVASYSLTLEVTDRRSRTATTSIDITVTDVNDNDPVCSPSSYAGSAAEDAATGTTILTLTCSDADTSTPNVAYSILAGNIGTAFTIVATGASAGEITTATGLDYETVTEYTLLVRHISEEPCSTKTHLSPERRTL